MASWSFRTREACASACLTLTIVCGLASIAPLRATAATGSGPHAPATSPIRDVRLAGRFVGGMAIADGVLAMAVGAAGAGHATELQKLELATGRLERLATSVYAGGAITAVSATGRWLVWMDQSAIQEGPTAKVRWTLFSENFRTGARVQLATSGKQASAWIPVAVASEGRVAWSEWLGSIARGNDVYVHDFRVGATTVALHGVHVGQAIPTRSGLLYLQTKFLDSSHYSSSVYFLASRGNAPVLLSPSRSADFIAFSNGWAAWKEPQFGDPQRLVALRIGSKRRVVVAGPMHSNIHLGNGFAVDYSIGLGRWELRALDSGFASATLLTGATPCLPCGVAVADRAVAWGELSSAAQSTPVVMIHIARILLQ